MYYVGCIAYDPNYLQHHGIKGQKWGIRRYQNPDGSLTEAGKRKYGTVENFKLAQEAKAATTQANKDFDDFYRKSGYRTLVSQKARENRDYAFNKWEKSRNNADKLRNKYKKSLNSKMVMEERNRAKERQKEKIKNGANKAKTTLGKIGAMTMGSLGSYYAMTEAKRLGINSLEKYATALLIGNAALGSINIASDYIGPKAKR